MECAALAIVLAVIYTVECWMFPFAFCPRCKGGGKVVGPGGRVFRNCRWCRGSGRRIRIGRRLFNAIRARQRDAS